MLENILTTNVVLWAVLAITLIATLAVAFRKDRKVAGVNKWIVAVVFGAVFVGALIYSNNLGMFSFMGIGALSVAGTPSSGGVASNAIQVCDIGNQVTVTLSGSDAYNGSATGGTHAYKINGGTTQTVSDAGTLTASPGDVLSILWEDGSSSASYYSALTSETVHCKGTDRIVQNLYKNGTLTIQVFNDQNLLINGGANNQTVNAGDVITIPIKVKGQYQRGLPYGGVMVAEYNSTYMQNVIVNLGGASTDTPAFYSVSSIGRNTKAYTVPAILGSQELDGTVTLQASATQDPGTAGYPVLTLYANNYYVDSNAGTFAGPSTEDSNNNKVGLNSATFPLYLI
jgi:hypothetical protein